MSVRETAAVAVLVAAVGAGACTLTRKLGEAHSDAGPICLAPNVHFGTETCVGELAARTFPFALCSCSDVDLGAGFRTDSFDHGAGPYDPTAVMAAGGGPVGVNGGVSVVAGAEVNGTLIVAGGGTLSIGDVETIRGDLKTNGNLVVGQSVLVRRDAWVRGYITASGSIFIAGNLVQPLGITPPAGLRVGGVTRSENFTIPAPCACASGDDAAILTAITEGRAANNNAEVPLTPADLTNPLGPGPIRLPCGRFYVDGVAGSAPLTITVEGRAALFVGGDFVAWDGLTLDLLPGAELDVFVAGNFDLGTAHSFGDPRVPAALRVYVAGASASMGNATTFAGNLYAPVATVATAQNIEIFGSVAAGGVHSTDGLAIHFDRAVLNAGVGCSVDTTPRSCATCSDCPGTDGCSNHYCGRCQQDVDCCDPLVCISGHCVPLVF
jgi:hypothetical protein